MQINVPQTDKPRVVIIGCGFGGLRLAKLLKDVDVQIVLIDKNNYHTFQPLLYQVATAGLEADSIAYPIRKIFKSQKNFHFRMGEVKEIYPDKNYVATNIGELSYDYLVIATGSTTNFFDNEEIERNGMPMKTVTEALNLRSLILQNFEKALLTKDENEIAALMNFVVVGGGPTGVELTGALCELKKHVLPNDYPELNFSKMRVILVENSDDVLQMMSEVNRQKAKNYLHELGAELILNNAVIAYDGNSVALKHGNNILSQNLIWAAGIKGLFITGLPENAVTNRGRILTDETCKVHGLINVFSIGDVALMKQERYPNGHPQVAPVAIQQAELVAENLQSSILSKPLKTFVYNDKGSMATVGRNRAVAEMGSIRFGGILGWFVWMGLHLMLLVGFRNKVVVFVNWLWNYINYDRNIRLIIRPYYKP